MSINTETAKLRLKMFEKLLVHLIPSLILVIFLSNEATATEAKILNDLKREMLGKTPEENFWRAESFYKEARKKVAKAPIGGGFYHPWRDSAYVLFAVMEGHLAAILAIDGYLLSTGFPRKSLLATSYYDTTKYLRTLIRIPDKGKTLATAYRVVYKFWFDLENREELSKRQGSDFYKMFESVVVKETDEAFDNIKFIIEGLKNEVMKEKTGKRIVNHSIEEEEDFFPSTDFDPKASKKVSIEEAISFLKRNPTPQTSEVAFQKADSLHKTATEILEKTPIRGGVYKKRANVLTAAMSGYLAVLRAIDGYLLSKGTSPNRLPLLVTVTQDTVKNDKVLREIFYRYEEALGKFFYRGKLLVPYFRMIYQNLVINPFGADTVFEPCGTQAALEAFLRGVEEEELKDDVGSLNIGLDRAKFIIQSLKEKVIKDFKAPPIDERYLNYVDIMRRKSRNRSPEQVVGEAESLYKSAPVLLQALSIDSGFYPPGYGNVSEASMKGYLAVVRAIDSYLLSTGVPFESLPNTATWDAEKYEKALKGIPPKGELLSSSFKLVYKNLFIAGYLDNERKVNIIKEGVNKAKFIIETLKEKAKKEKGWR